MPPNHNKKIFTILLIVVAIVATAFLLYFIFFSGKGGEAPSGFPTSTPPIVTPISPIGNGGVTGPKEGNPLPSGFRPVLRQITNTPTAGGVIFEKAGKPTVRYMERAKGNVYETDAVNIKSIRLTNTTIPQIYEAYWKKTGENVLARFLKDSEQIQTFSATIAPRSGGEGELRGEFLASNIKDLSVSPSGNQIFYLTESNGGIVGVLASFGGAKKLQIFESPFQQWLSNFPKENTVTITSKAGVESEGLMMSVDTATGKTNIVLSDIRGLTTLPNSALSKILYSISENQTFTTRLLETTGSLEKYFALTTLPEKCVWSKLKKDLIYCAVPESLPAADYPDSWYQGLVSFRDEIWSVDTSSGAMQFIMNLGDQSRADFDAINLSINEKENFILFTNKNDLTLWELQISP